MDANQHADTITLIESNAQRDVQHANDKIP